MLVLTLIYSYPVISGLVIISIHVLVGTSVHAALRRRR